MQPSLSPVDNDPHDVLEVAPDVVLVARAEEELSRLAKARSGDRSSQPRIEPTLPRTDAAAAAREVPAVDTSFRAARTDNGPSMAQRLGRGLAGLLLAVVIGGAAVAWRASGEVAKETIANFAPAFAAKVLPAADSSAQAAQDPAPAAVPVQQAAAEAPEAATDAPAETTPAATPPAATTPATTPPAATTTLAAAAAAAIPADQSQRLQSMVRDLASLGQEVAVLKASLAELKASNEQMSHDMAKLSEQNQRLKVSAMQAKAAMPARKPAPTFRPTQAAAPALPPSPATYPPPQAAPYPPPGAYPPPQAAYVPPPAPVGQPQGDPDIPRPPMPVRQ